MEIEAILRRAVDCGASDIFVAAGLPLTFKIKGEQQRNGDKAEPFCFFHGFHNVPALSSSHFMRLGTMIIWRVPYGLCVTIF